MRTCRNGHPIMPGSRDLYGHCIKCRKRHQHEYGKRCRAALKTVRRHGLESLMVASS